MFSLVDARQCFETLGGAARLFPRSLRAANNHDNDDNGGNYWHIVRLIMAMVDVALQIQPPLCVPDSDYLSQPLEYREWLFLCGNIRYDVDIDNLCIKRRDVPLLCRLRLQSWKRGGQSFLLMREGCSGFAIMVILAENWSTRVLSSLQRVATLHNRYHVWNSLKIGHPVLLIFNLYQVHVW